MGNAGRTSSVRRLAASAFLAAGIGGILIACGAGDTSDSGSPSPTTTDVTNGGTTVGPEGGTFTENGVTVTIPAGALAASTPIHITESTVVPNGYAVSGKVYRFEPSGTHFSAPITIALPSTKPEIVYWTIDGSETEFEPVETEFDEVAATAKVQITHFSGGFVGTTPNGITCIVKQPSGCPGTKTTIESPNFWYRNEPYSEWPGTRAIATNSIGVNRYMNTQVGDAIFRANADESLWKAEEHAIGDPGTAYVSKGVITNFTAKAGRGGSAAGTSCGKGDGSVWAPTVTYTCSGGNVAIGYGPPPKKPVADAGVSVDSGSSLDASMMSQDSSEGDASISAEDAGSQDADTNSTDSGPSDSGVAVQDAGTDFGPDAGAGDAGGGGGWIGPAGGTINEDGVTVSVPAGALTVNTWIHISDSSVVPTGYGVSGKVYHFEPVGTHFASAVTVTLPSSKPEIVFWSADGNETKFAPVQTEYNPTLLTAAAKVTHFSNGFVGTLASSIICVVKQPFGCPGTHTTVEAPAFWYVSKPYSQWPGTRAIATNSIGVNRYMNTQVGTAIFRANADESLWKAEEHAIGDPGTAYVSKGVITNFTAKAGRGGSAAGTSCGKGDGSVWAPTVDYTCSGGDVAIGYSAPK